MNIHIKKEPCVAVETSFSISLIQIEYIKVTERHEYFGKLVHIDGRQKQ